MSDSEHGSIDPASPMPWRSTSFFRRESIFFPRVGPTIQEDSNLMWLESLSRSGPEGHHSFIRPSAAAQAIRNGRHPNTPPIPGLAREPANLSIRTLAHGTRALLPLPPPVLNYTPFHGFDQATPYVTQDPHPLVSPELDLQPVNYQDQATPHVVQASYTPPRPPLNPQPVNYSVQAPPYVAQAPYTTPLQRPRPQLVAHPSQNPAHVSQVADAHAYPLSSSPPLPPPYRDLTPSPGISGLPARFPPPEASAATARNELNATPEDMEPRGRVSPTATSPKSYLCPSLQRPVSPAPLRTTAKSYAPSATSATMAAANSTVDASLSVTTHSPSTSVSRFPTAAPASEEPRALYPEDIVRNKFGQRLDPKISCSKDHINYIKDRKLCNFYFLLGPDKCKAGWACKNRHEATLSDSDRRALKIVARMAPCRNGTECDDPCCIYGHNCTGGPAKNGGKFGKLCGWTNCTFPRSMHIKDRAPYEPLCKRLCKGRVWTLGSDSGSKVL